MRNTFNSILIVLLQLHMHHLCKDTIFSFFDMTQFCQLDNTQCRADTDFLICLLISSIMELTLNKLQHYTQIPNMVFCHSSLFILKFGLFCVLRAFAHHGGKEWLFELMWTFCQLEPVWPFCFDKSYEKDISAPQRNHTHFMFVYHFI